MFAAEMDMRSVETRQRKQNKIILDDINNVLLFSAPTSNYYYQLIRASQRAIYSIQSTIFTVIYVFCFFHLLLKSIEWGQIEKETRYSKKALGLFDCVSSLSFYNFL